MIILRVTIDDNRGLIANLVGYVPSWFEVNFFRQVRWVDT